MDADVICPFYLSDDRCTRIRCESCVPHAKALMLDFGRKADMAAFKAAYCIGEPQQCKLWWDNFDKYNEQGALRDGC